MNIMNELFTVVMPVYNVEKYLRKCLDSVSTQTYENFECIMIDDGSTDNSGKICDEYANSDSRFRVIHQENQGLSAARNKGIDEAKGKYLIFVDSDDWIGKDFLKNSVEVFESEPNTDIICFNFHKFMGERRCPRKYFKYHKILNPKSAIYDSIRNRIYVDVWNKAFRIEIFGDDLRFPLGMYAECFEVSVQVLYRAREIHCHPYYAYNYNVGTENSIGKIKRKEQHRDYLILKERRNKFVIEKYPDLKESVEKYV